jgi:hypothetical protein
VAAVLGTERLRGRSVSFLTQPALSAPLELEISDIVAAAQRGDENSRYRASRLGHRLSGDEREELFAAIDLADMHRL